MKIKSLFPYIIAFIVFVLASVLYFKPVLSGKKIKQSDIVQSHGMVRDVLSHRASNNKEPYWLGNAFSGMPAYQVNALYPNDIIKYIDKVIRFLPRPADYLFLYFFSFFILLSVLKVDWKLAILGSLAFGFSTYLIIIFGAGHNAKAHAIGYMPLVLAGVISIFNRNFLLGFTLTTIAMGLEIVANHIQMTYYLGFILLILGIVQFINAYKDKNLVLFGKQSALIIAALILGISINATRLLSTKEYAEHSTRGKSELTIHPDGSAKEKTSGLDKSYITEYSYGKWETFNLLIPRFMGGGTVEKLGKGSNFYNLLEEKAGPKVAKDYSSQVFTYWGTQPIVEAPAYIGIVIFFLFLLGAFLVKNQWKYWLVSATIFSIVMSWGKNFSVLTNLFIDYFPLYDKFRAVSSIQVIAELCIPLLGILGLKAFFSPNIELLEKKEALKKTFYSIGGLTLIFIVFGSSLFAFEGLRDMQYQELPELIDALIADRKHMLFIDSLRSFILIILTALILWLFLNDKIKKTALVISSLGVLILFDLLTIDTTYVNDDDFTFKRNVDKPFKLTEADTKILKDKSYYRVANFSGNILNEARTSYFHNSIGGYHAAKMRRYQNLFDYQIAKNNIDVLNMLNTKYFILDDDNIQENSEANGNVWFIKNLKPVTTVNDEIKALDTLKTKKTAIFNSKEFSHFNPTPSYKNDSTSVIKMTTNNLSELSYESNTKETQFAVFSEIYYKDGWNAYIDGKKAPHIRVNYILRGLEIPKGNHNITFKFEPDVIKKGTTISLISYMLLLITFLFWLYKEKRKILF